MIQKPLPKPAGLVVLELVAQEPKIYLDGAHNVPAIERLVEFIQEQEEPVTILFSALRRGHFQEMLGLLEKRLPHVPLILTSFAYDSALSEKNQQDRDFVADYQQFIEKWQSDGQRDFDYHRFPLLYIGSSSEVYKINNFSNRTVEHCRKKIQRNKNAKEPYFCRISME